MYGTNVFKPEEQPTRHTTTRGNIMYECNVNYNGQLKLKESTDTTVTTPEAVAEVFKDLEQMTQETFQCLTLDTKNNVIDRYMVTLGINNSSLVHPRELFRLAILDNANAVVLCHNHPSGNPSPSSEDIRITKQLIEAGEIMGIKVLDHIIIGNKGRFISLREDGMVTFK